MLITGCRGAEPSATQARNWPPSELRSGGGNVLAELSPDEVHRFRLRLQPGWFLRLVVDQQGVDAAVALEAPDGSLVVTADRLINDLGPELILGVSAQPGDYTLVVRGLGDSHRGRYAARVEVLRPATPRDRRSADAYQRFTAAERQLRLQPDAAAVAWEQARAVWHELGEVALEGEAVCRIARHAYDRREYPRSAALYRQAADAFALASDPRWEAIARAGIALNLLPLADPRAAAEQATRARALAHQASDPRTEAKALHLLAQAHQNQGELQAALDGYQEALKLWPQDERRLRPATLHNLGVLHARSFHDAARGRALLLAARDAWGPGQERDQARTLSQLGRLAFEQGELDEARRHYEAALALRSDRDRCGSAVLLARLALVSEAQGDRPAADLRLNAALATVQAQTCPRTEPTVVFLAAELAAGRGELSLARTRYERCAALFTAQGDRLLTAECQAGTARVARNAHDESAALMASRNVLAILEGVRPTVLREDLRTSFFSGARSAFDFHIDLLLATGAEEEAWISAEQARARVLRDLLAEAGVGIRQGALPALVAQERTLQFHLNAVESQRLAASDSVSAERLQALRQAVDAAAGELESVRGELRRHSHRSAALADPGPVTLAATQQLLADGTLLLEYRLGAAASTLWVVTRDALLTARLPPQREIEPLVLESVRWMQSLEWPGSNPPVLCQLSQMLLGPVAEQLGQRRLVIVPDGALEVLSFAALPDPTHPVCSAAPALADAHEIVYLPSAATLLAQQRRLAGRRPAPGWLVVVADPVYDPADERLARGNEGRTAPTGGNGIGSLQTLRRLPGSAAEAATLVAGLPPGKTLVKTGFDATRETVLSGALRGFRILHFATHGVLNAEQPLLSSLALSAFDSRGQPNAGNLPAHEIYDLDLPAELVVLSACATALGRQISGEGLVSGLPRAFLYAGATRVLVSLWAVEDHSTRDLMERFYRGLFHHGRPPARALQEAQRELRQAGRLPGQWAGFVLLGDWRPLPPFSD